MKRNYDSAAWLGAAKQQERRMNESLLIDDFGPLALHRPASIADLCGLVRSAASSARGVYPVGGRTTLEVGFPPIKPGIALDTTALNEVIEYPARDMTITAQAGITIAQLQNVLAAEGQWLPIDVPHPDQATLGGAIALNISGPRRYGYGTFRDYVIGISFVTDEGQEVKAGGRVVKNVAGYDLMKLQVGAAGTLGVITKATLKVKPKPEAAAMVHLHCSPADLGSVLDSLHGSRSRPVIVDLAMGHPEANATWALWVGFEEKAETVEWQIATLLEELRGTPASGVMVERGPEALARIPPLIAASGPSQPLAFKANVRPSQTASICNFLRCLQGVAIHAQALNGIIHGAADTREGLLAALEHVTGPVADPAGNAVIRRCPADWKKTLAVWGRASNDRDLMRHVKQTLDPGNVFNPGRLFG